MTRYVHKFTNLGCSLVVFVFLATVVVTAVVAFSFGRGLTPPVPETPYMVDVFEDGSFVMSDGSSGCIPTMLCDHGDADGTASK